LVVAGLLHDLGKTCIPREILVKPGKLTDSERLVIREHPIVGARMLLASAEPMELAAVVAYEHHVMLDGGGYPALPDARGAQYASMLVHVSATCTMPCGPTVPIVQPGSRSGRWRTSVSEPVSSSTPALPWPLSR